MRPGSTVGCPVAAASNQAIMWLLTDPGHSPPCDSATMLDCAHETHGADMQVTGSCPSTRG